MRLAAIRAISDVVQGRVLCVHVHVFVYCKQSGYTSTANRQEIHRNHSSHIDVCIFVCMYSVVASVVIPAEHTEDDLKFLLNLVQSDPEPRIR